MDKRQRRAAITGVGGGGLASLALAGTLLLNAMPAAAVDFANPAFQRVWNRTDYLVATGQVARTFFWGPQPNAAAREEYVDAPDGTNTRLVQYFDKSRMEINNPNGNPNDPFYVTNGLLTIELISGMMQIGNNAFTPRYSAEIPISGDNDDTQAPTYASFLQVSNTRLGDHPQPDRRGQFVTATINKAGQVANDPSKASVPLTKVAYYEPITRHNIPEAFWNFLNATGPISDSGQIRNARLIDPWFYASGLPISDAYWSRVKIKGVMQDVMIQAYERRVLTYVPTNPTGFQVEMGNIGLHYYDWRYKDAGKPTTTPAAQATTTPIGQATSTPPGQGSVTPQPTSTGTPPTATPTRTGTPPTATATATATPNVLTQGRIVFTSDRNGGKRQIWRINADGTNAVNLTASSPASNNDYPSYSPDFTKIAFASDRDNNGGYEIYTMNADGSGLRRLTSSPGDDYEPSWSPDGTKIVFTSNRGDQPGDIFVMNADGTNQVNITQWPSKDADPSWSPNGRIVFTSHRSGTDQIYTVNPDGSGLTGPLTSAGNNFLPEWNPRANLIVFVSDRDGGVQQIYTMKADGTNQTRLTNTDAGNWDPSYAPDGSMIAFSSFRIAPDNMELFTMNADGSNQNRITIQPGTDNHPSWGIAPPGK